MTQTADPTALLRRMLDARSVAVVGASSDPKKIGFRPVDYLLRIGYTGAIYPVNPGMERLGDLACYPSLSELPEVPDLVAVVVAAHRCEAIVREAAEMGVPAALVITSGFGEIDAEGAALERTLADIARAHDMVLVGPNSVGVIHAPNRLAVTFTEALSRGPLTRSGGIGIVSQSGAFGTIIFALARAADLGLRSYVSTGNEAAFGLPDFLHGLVEDPEIRVVGGYIEAIRDGAGFERAARRAADLGKPIVLVKVGASEAGRSAASSHTGAIAGNDDAYAAAFRRFGVVRAEDERHLLGLLDTFDIWYRLPRGRRVAVVSMSGGAGVLLSDDLDRRGVELAEFPDALVDELRTMLPRFAALRNPVDITGQFVANNAGLQEVLEVIAGSDAVDAVLLFAGIGWTGDGAWAQAVVDATRAAAPIMVVTQFAPDEAKSTLRAGGVPVFESPIQASRTLASVLEWTTGRRFAVPAGRSTHGALAGGGATEAEAKAMLAAAGVRVPRGVVSATPEEAGDLAAALHAERLVVKGQGPGLEHKSDLGAVVVGVTAPEVAAACAEMAARVRAAAPSARLETYLVEEMAPEGVDVVVGSVWEEPFGHLVVVGLGGTAVEVLGDVAFGLAPMGVDEAASLVRSLRAFPLLDGHRGAEPLDVDALAEAVSAISHLVAAAGPAIRELDVNPVRVLPRGQGVVALDALVVSQAT
ncbi:MAG TPA: acetate--CoA ligase family protein [Acidimicrobiia bacterium]|nr:acetate--CoA ligase family protein [Acidimicrobiia bacterium]